MKVKIYDSHRKDIPMNMKRIENTPHTLAPGLYDKQGHMTCSFEELVLSDRIHICPEGVLCRNRYITGKLVIPDYIRKIRPWAFWGCFQLTEVILPESITEIGQEAFYMCLNLQRIHIPDRVTEIPFAAFALCRALKTVKLPKNLAKIGMRAFDGCHGLSGLKLPERLSEIERFAFYHCDNLEQLRFPDYLQMLQTGAFDCCTRLRIASVCSYTDMEHDAFPPHTLVEIRNDRNEQAIMSVAEQGNYSERQ